MKKMMQMPRFRYALAALLLTTAVGCVPTVPPPIRYVGLQQETDEAVDRMLASVQGVIPPRSTILVSTLADLNAGDLRDSDNFGRLVSEEIAEHLIQAGFRIPEIRLASRMLVRPTGEFVLSRRERDIRRHQEAEFVVTGTFVPRGYWVYVNLKLIRLADGIPVGAASFQKARLIRQY